MPKAEAQKVRNRTMKNIFQSIRQWHRRNETINALQRLDDRTLADIGIVRGNIDMVARKIR